MSELLIRRRETVSDLPIHNQVHPLLARIYASRGLEDLGHLGRSLQQLQTGQDIRGLDAAVARLILALEQDQHILSSVISTVTARQALRLVCLDWA